MKQVRLYNGVTMPSIGYGVFQIPCEETEKAVSEALETGYRMIDTAASYFNEKKPCAGSAWPKISTSSTSRFPTPKWRLSQDLTKARAWCGMPTTFQHQRLSRTLKYTETI